MTLPILPHTVGALLEYLMLEHHIRDRAKLADEMNVSPATLQRFYQGIQPLKAIHILHIHEYFGVAVWKIRELSGQHTDPAKRKAGLQAGSAKQKTED